MKYYYCTTHKYEIGEIINYGFFRQYVSNCNPYLQLLETHFNYIRNKVAPNKIGRLECIFAFTNQNDVEDFVLMNDKKIYEIEPVDLNMVSYHNYKIYSYFAGLLSIKPQLLNDDNLFELYWNGDSSSQYLNFEGQKIDYVEEAHIGCAAKVVNIF